MGRLNPLALVTTCLTAGVLSCADERMAGDDLAILHVVTQGYCRGQDSRKGLVSDEPENTSQQSALPAELEKRFQAQIEARSTEVGRWPMTQICQNLRVESGDRIRAFFARDKRIPAGWEGFEAEFGASSYVRISRPAYSEDRQRAMVIMGSHCGELCGHGTIVEVQRTSHGWRVLQWIGTWIS